MKLKNFILLGLLSFSNMSFAQTGLASFYGVGDKFQGKRTACGNKFNTHVLVAAHRSFPCGTKVRVTNLNNNQSVVVTIRDRGPFRRGRVIDLSYAAKNSIRMGGLAPVKVEAIN